MAVPLQPHADGDGAAGRGGARCWACGCCGRRGVAGVVARSAIHGTAMVIYFGALAFLPVAIVAAGLFTAPIFVLLISRFAYGHAIGPVRVAAVGIGFLGVILVLGPSALAGASLAALLRWRRGAMYAMGNIATKEWCAAESAETLLAASSWRWGSSAPSAWRCCGWSRCRFPTGPKAF